MAVIVAWLLACCGGAWPGRARADEVHVAAVQVEGRVHRTGETAPDGSRIRRGRAHISARATYRLAAAARGDAPLVLLDFAGAVQEVPPRLDPVAASSYLDGPFDRGRLHVREIIGAAHWRRTQAGHLEVVLAPGATEFSVGYEVRVPRRPWPFGCVRRRCSLAGATAPLPAVRVAPSEWIPDQVAWSVDLRFATDPRGDEIVIEDGGGARISHPTVVFGRAWHRLEFDHRGVRVAVLTPQARPSGQIPDEGPLQWRRDAAGRSARVAREALEILDDMAAVPPAGTRISVIQGPLRSAPAEAHPGAVLLSDQAWELLPAKRLLRFHELAVARATFEALWYRHFVHQDPSARPWVAGLVAQACLTPWEIRREHPDEYARDILRNFTFMPAVDRFLYTGQSTFSGSYFRGVEDEPPVRNHPHSFANQRASGRRIHDKLVDLMGRAALERGLLDLVEHPERDPREAFERAWGRELGWFFAQWAGPYPKIDVGIRRIDSHRDGDGFEHRLSIERHADRAVVEPLQVFVEERSGARQFLVWNGEGPWSRTELGTFRSRHELRFRTTSRLKLVKLDPRRRLYQTPLPPRANVDPEFDDRRPRAPRFLYTGAGLYIAASEFARATTPQARAAAVDAYAFFEGSLRHDTRRTGVLEAYHDRETWGGVAGGPVFWMGPKVNRQRRRVRLAVIQGVESLNGLTLDPQGGLRLSQTLTLIDDNRGFGMWPQRGHRLLAGVTAQETIRVDGRDDHRYALQARATWVQLFPLAMDHVLATETSLAWLVPLASRPEFRSLLRGGGIDSLGGYVGDEIFGLARLLVQAEYRHEWIRNLHGNVAHVAWLRGLGGVLFGGAVSMAPCDGIQGFLGRDSWYGQVGYGLTARTFVFGVTPQLVRLDVAVPLVRREARCLGRDLPEYLAQVQGLTDARRLLPPVNVNLTFVPPF